MTVGIWRANSGKFQRHIWKLAAVLYDVTFAVDKNGAGSGVKVNVASCITPPNLLLNGNATFVIDTDNEFNVSCFIFCPIVFLHCIMVTLSWQYINHLLL